MQFSLQPGLSSPKIFLLKNVMFNDLYGVTKNIQDFVY